MTNRFHIYVSLINALQLISYTLPNPHKNRCLSDHYVPKGHPSATPPNVVVTEKDDMHVPSCHCQKNTLQCSSTIHWRQPISKIPITGYRLIFFQNIYYEGDDEKRCYHLHSSARSFTFTFDGKKKKNSSRLFVDGEDFRRLSFHVIAEPAERKQVVYYIECPKVLQITPPLPHVVVRKGSSHTFNCSFTGYPLPNTVTWTHTPSNGNPRRVLSSNDANIDIVTSKSYTTLTIKPVSDQHNGFYKCYISNYFGKNYAKHSQGSIRIAPKREYAKETPPSMLDRKLATQIGVLVGALLLVVALTVGTFYVRHQRRLYNPIAGQQQQVYISYYAITMEQRNRIVKLAFNLEKQFPGVNVVLDLTREVEINSAGGLAQWVPKQILQAEKIIVVLSPGYLTTIETDEKRVAENLVDAEKVEEQCASTKKDSLKAMMEYRLIKNMLHEKDKQIDQLVIVRLNRSMVDLPLAFMGRPCYDLSNTSDLLKNTSFAQLFGDRA